MSWEKYTHIWGFCFFGDLIHPCSAVWSYSPLLFSSCSQILLKFPSSFISFKNITYWIVLTVCAWVWDHLTDTFNSYFPKENNYSFDFCILARNTCNCSISRIRNPREGNSGGCWSVLFQLPMWVLLGPLKGKILLTTQFYKLYLFLVCDSRVVSQRSG